MPGRGETPAGSARKIQRMQYSRRTRQAIAYRHGGRSVSFTKLRAEAASLSPEQLCSTPLPSSF
jgi:hypothetical protein